MVGISFKKKSDHIVFLETYSTYDDYKKTNVLEVPLESLIIHCIYKYCTTKFIDLKFISINKSVENATPPVKLFDENVKFLDANDVPWLVASCIYPVVLCDVVIVTGLCAVARHICMFRNCPIISQEHSDGILGFRQSCLQAPNEVSIWTKFCEIDLVKTAKHMLSAVEIKELAENLVRFEHHLKKPVRVHNVYKIAQERVKNEDSKQQVKGESSKQQVKHEDCKQQVKNEDSNPEVKDEDSNQQVKIEDSKLQVQNEDSKQHDDCKQQVKNEDCKQQLKTEDSKQAVKEDSKEQVKDMDSKICLEAIGAKESLDTSRVPKARKWKSNVQENVIDCSTKIEDLHVYHEFAEGPFLTLADLVLLPSYHIIIQTFGEQKFESLLPFTYKWYKNITSLPRTQIYLTCMSKLNLKNISSLEIVTVPETEDVSLYKCDPKRHNPKKRLYTKEDDIEKALSCITEEMEFKVCNNEFQTSLNWDEIPEGANPYCGHLPDERVTRKSQQLENIAVAALNIAKEGDLIVDFCCGSGHLGILLAHLLPNCTIILLENKVQSLVRAKERVQRMRLKNVYYYQCNVDFFIGKFDIGIGLHACGIATDLILDKCLKVNAKFILSPCCYGSLHATDRMVYPRSRIFGSVPIEQYLCIGHTADQTHIEHPLAVRGARCMAIIDSDRGRLAEQFGYKVTLSRLKPLTCTPKNNLLIGIPS